MFLKFLSCSLRKINYNAQKPVPPTGSSILTKQINPSPTRRCQQAQKFPTMWQVCKPPAQRGDQGLSPAPSALVQKSRLLTLYSGLVLVFRVTTQAVPMENLLPGPPGSGHLLSCSDGVCGFLLWDLESRTAAWPPLALTCAQLWRQGCPCAVDAAQAEPRFLSEELCPAQSSCPVLQSNFGQVSTSLRFVETQHWTWWRPTALQATPRLSQILSHSCEISRISEP